jgi:hypothetical protein
MGVPACVASVLQPKRQRNQIRRVHAEVSGIRYEQLIAAVDSTKGPQSGNARKLFGELIARKLENPR